MAVYSLSLLTTRAQCDAVLAYANDKLETLTFRGQESAFHTSNAGEAATALADELKGLITYITAITPAVAALEPGDERTKLANELRRRTDRRDELVSRQSQSGPEVLIERELEQNLLHPLIPIVQDLINQVTAHRDTLTT